MKKYQIRDNETDDIIDKDLSYEQALHYVDISDEKFSMEPMRGDDQNDCSAL